MHRKHGEMVERTFEHALDNGGMRRAHLKGRENISKRYLIHIAAFNPGLIMRMILGIGTPKGWADAAREGRRGFLQRCIVRARQATALVREVTRCVWEQARMLIKPKAARFAA